MINLPGTWITKDKTLVYRLVPKCACSTIGQILYYLGNGQFYDGDIHKAEEGLYKWSQEHNQDMITHVVRSRQNYSFSCVRNPYTRILSCFFDKIAGIQADGNRYRGNLVYQIAPHYGIEVGSPETGFDFDQIKSFRRFLLFARDTILWRRPIEPDLHWASSSDHIRAFLKNGGHLDQIIATENFGAGMSQILINSQNDAKINLETVPRFNESAQHGPQRLYPVADYFDDFSRHLMWEIYRQDFELFHYNIDDPATAKPTADIDPDAVTAKLSSPSRKV